ncbi:RNA ligase family protein [Yinghuangia seranimata]|uniref:RNA ligase family protein n=1 Tax=Yinghuangia seranimata TaxID=408067 RepID=UPI00248BCB59|nr:RNA ligase family protein [Yinghuangia seranimata]MDI2128735.1 RNA ligase family protein [Yinghuangia seranimata]
MRVHYPRTPHVPWSPGASADDVRAGDLAGLVGREVVVTEKLDGENTTLYRDGVHARSLDSAHHPSRAWVKALQGRIGGAIPDGWRVCGENMFARHSIAYDDLHSWFYGFSVWDGERCLGWDETVRFLRRVGVPTPPVLWRGVFDARALEKLKLDTARQEGYVVRSVEGFPRGEFGLRVAKWVRPRHVQTDTHWMFAEVVENGLGAGAPLWAVRSGAEPDLDGLHAALGFGPGDPRLFGADAPDASVVAARVADAAARLDGMARTGDARLAGVLATLLHDAYRGPLAARLAASLGMPLARRIADLVGLHAVVHQPYPDEHRRSGLARMAFAADLGVLHAAAHAALAGRTDAEAAAAREQVEWSALYAEDAGLLGEAPLAPLRSGMRTALADLDSEAADRCWAEARELYVAGRIASFAGTSGTSGTSGASGVPGASAAAEGADHDAAVAEAVAATWRWRSGDFPRLIHLVGPSGSGKSRFAKGLAGVETYVAMDDLREDRGERADQRANGDVLRQALDRLDAALARGGTTVWDATSLNPQQRGIVHAVAKRRDALVTHAVVLVDADEAARRNGSRAHPVPPGVLAAQLRRFVPPYPGHAHRTWYVGAAGTVDDTDGSLFAGAAGDVDGTGSGF